MEFPQNKKILVMGGLVSVAVAFSLVYFNDSMNEPVIPRNEPDNVERPLNILMKDAPSPQLLAIGVCVTKLQLRGFENDEWNTIYQNSDGKFLKMKVGEEAKMFTKANIPVGVYNGAKIFVSYHKKYMDFNGDGVSEENAEVKIEKHLLTREELEDTKSKVKEEIYEEEDFKPSFWQFFTNWMGNNLNEFKKEALEIYENKDFKEDKPSFEGFFKNWEGLENWKDKARDIYENTDFKPTFEEFFESWAENNLIKENGNYYQPAHTKTRNEIVKGGSTVSYTGSDNPVIWNYTKTVEKDNKKVKTHLWNYDGSGGQIVFDFQPTGTPSDPGHFRKIATPSDK